MIETYLKICAIFFIIHLIGFIKMEIKDLKWQWRVLKPTFFQKFKELSIDISFLLILAALIAVVPLFNILFLFISLSEILKKS